MEHILEVNHLCKKYSDTAFGLKDLSFSVKKGTIVGLVGRNGAGKTTTIKTILNLIKRDSGVVKLFGEEQKESEYLYRNDIAAVFDSISFHEELTPKKLEKVLRDIYSNWKSDAFYEYLKRFGIPVEKKIKTFSRGMSMKLAIAAALSHEAKLLILDEALSNLDPISREEILDLFFEYIEDENNSILISSHISSDLEKVADYIVFIDNGNVLLSESKDALLYSYGIGRMKKAEFEALDRAEYAAHRIRGLQTEVLVTDKKNFSRNHPDIVVDNATVDEVLKILIKGE